jgi:hypothetical protein
MVKYLVWYSRWDVVVDPDQSGSKASRHLFKSFSMSIDRWNEDDQYLISYVCKHEALKENLWEMKHEIFNRVCHLIGRPERTKNALTSYWTRMKTNAVKMIPLIDQARILEIVRITAFSLRLYNS